MKRDSRIRPWDWLLIAGAVLAPMTGLRIWKIGPAEALCFLWALGRLDIRNRLKLDPFIRFFCIFMVSMLVGTFICLVIAPQELALSGWATWLYLAFVTCVLYRALKSNPLQYNEKLFDRFAMLSVLWYAFLYVYSLTVSRSFLGAELWYSRMRYSGGGTNPHQVAVLMCGVAFWFTRRIANRKRILWNTVLFAGALFIEGATQSSTGTAALFLGLLTAAIIYTLRFVRGRTAKSVIIVLEIGLGLIVALIFRSALYGIVYEWIADDSNGLGRFQLWSSFGAVFVKSPIFGLGPGAHAASYGRVNEFHNSYLDICAASGLIGLFAFVMFSARIIRTAVRGDLLLLPIMVCLYLYGLAGFAFRRLALWVVIALVTVIALQRREALNRSRLEIK